MTGVAKNAIQKLTRELGEAVMQYQDNVLRNLKCERVQYSLGITFFCHNFVRIHQTLRMTPAMKAGVANHKWSIEEMVDLLPEPTHPNREKKSN